MNDLISRRSALEALTVTEEMGTAELLWLLTTRINDLPSIQPEPTVTGKFPVITLDTTFKNEASNINTASYDRDVVGTTIPTKLFEGFAKLSPLSTIEAELIRHGRWIDREARDGGSFEWRYECSACGKKNILETRFCPNCGAKMEASDD